MACRFSSFIGSRTGWRTFMICEGRKVAGSTLLDCQSFPIVHLLYAWWDGSFMPYILIENISRPSESLLATLPRAPSAALYLRPFPDDDKVSKVLENMKLKLLRHHNTPWRHPPQLKSPKRFIDFVTVPVSPPLHKHCRLNFGIYLSPKNFSPGSER